MSEHDEQDVDEVVATLRSIMLPAAVPVVPLIDLGVRFCSAEHVEASTGTWFDVVVLPDDRVAIVVGEAPGTGIDAVVAMGQVSAVLRAGLTRDGDLVGALGLADVFSERLADARGTTAVVAVLDPANGVVTYATSGQPAPVLRTADGTVDLLATTGGGPLGTGSGTGLAVATRPLAAGDTVLLASACAYRGSHPIDSAVAGTTDDTAAAGSAAALVDQVGDALRVDPLQQETLALVAARVRPGPRRRMSTLIHSDLTAVRRARGELETWLDEIGASPMDQIALVHATAELVTNSVEHGGRGDGERVELRAELGEDGVALVEVVDSGSWQVASEDIERGRGLAMAAGLVDELSVSSDVNGTRAVLRHRLSWPVPIQTFDPLPEGAHGADGAGSGSGDLNGTGHRKLELVRTSSSEVGLRGAVDHDDVERLAAEILVASRGGTARLTLDLSEVTRLSSSGVRLLADLTSVNRSVGMSGAGVEIITTADSLTQRILDDAQVPHRGR